MSKATETVRYRLSTEAGVTAVVGAGSNARIYPQALPQKPTYAAIVYEEVSSRRLAGVWTDPGVAIVTVRVTCCAPQYTDASDLRDLCRAALERYGTAVTGTPINGVTVYDITVGPTAEDYDAELDMHLLAIDFDITHEE